MSFRTSKNYWTGKVKLGSTPSHPHMECKSIYYPPKWTPTRFNSISMVTICLNCVSLVDDLGIFMSSLNFNIIVKLLKIDEWKANIPFLQIVEMKTFVPYYKCTVIIVYHKCDIKVICEHSCQVIIHVGQALC